MNLKSSSVLNQKGHRIRLIASDLDDTLLNSQKELTPRTQKAIKDAIRAGIEFVPASGRSFSGLPTFLRTQCHYAILMNGGMVVQIEPKITLYQCAFTREETLKIYDTLWRLYQRPVSVFLEGEAYMQESQKKDVAKYETPGMAAFIQGNRISVPDIRNKILTSPSGAGKIGVLHYSSEHDATTLQEIIKKIVPCSVKDAGDCFDINPNGIDKGTGLKRLAKILHIPMEETMAFGDAGNDVPMLREAGLGICMENGTAETKNAADYVAESNNEDGEAKVIEKILSLRS